MNQYTPITIYPNEDGYTVVTREPTETGLREVSDTFADYDSMDKHLRKTFGEY